QQYVYAGSEDGKVRYWDIESGDVVNTVNVGAATKADANHNDSESRKYTRSRYGQRRRGGSDGCVTRDVSMHPYLPVLVSTSWCGPEGDEGAVVVHGPSDGFQESDRSSPKRHSDGSSSSPTKRARGDGEAEDEEGWMDEEEADTQGGNESEDSDEDYVPPRRTGIRVVQRGGRIYIIR
ncbi:hypothetical protein HDU93_008425, partial [Gonapodya sp. JEL0774]